MPDTKSVETIAQDLEAFRARAREFAAEVHPPLLVLLSGNLGAGKTTFVSEVLKAWGIQGANSPTFNLRNDYDTAAFHVIHLDFYRLKENDAALDLLPPDEDYSRSVVFAEWPEKAPAHLFQPFQARLGITITILPEGSRQLSRSEAPAYP